jgi:hypothetical protein
MEAYEQKTHEIVRRFIGSKSSYADCISDLDAALTSFLPRMVDGQLVELRLMMLANITRVNFEMAQRDVATAV